MLRRQKPARSDVEPKGSYRQYRDQLEADFNSRCGYCDAHNDVLWARGHYHIDHFAPHSLFPELKETYTNLVYACPFCNRAKSNKWHGNNSEVHNDGVKGFIDPCENEYDEHLSRTEDGKIVPRTLLGEHIAEELKLRLARHQMSWQSEALLSLRDRVDTLLDDPRLEGGSQQRLLREFRELTNAYEQAKRSAL